jgi:hypothetical protein
MEFKIRGELLNSREFGQMRLADAGLDIRDGVAFGLLEMNLGTEQQRAENEVGEGENDVEIFVHVAVMEEMVAVEAEINAGAFDVALLGEVHTPVHVFVSAIITSGGDQRANGDGPGADSPRGEEERQNSERDQHGAIPPGHGNGVLVLFINEMISVVGFKSLMMHERVGTKGVIEFSNRAVHEIAVERPFKEGGKNNGGEKSDGHPKGKIVHSSVRVITRQAATKNISTRKYQSYHLVTTSRLRQLHSF